MRTSYGTGFKTPSLSQLFDPVTGNTNLSPEKVKNFEVGFEQGFSGKSTVVGLSYFDSDYSNLISFDPVNFKSINLGETRLRGIETSVKFKLGLKLELTSHSNYFFKQNNKDGRLIRRPKSSWSASINYKANAQFGILLSHRQVGERIDFDATTFAKKSMPSYNVSQLIGEYKFLNKNSVYIRFENLFNQQYEEIDGFGTAPFSIYAGGKISL